LKNLFRICQAIYAKFWVSVGFYMVWKWEFTSHWFNYPWFEWKKANQKLDQVWTRCKSIHDGPEMCQKVFFVKIKITTLKKIFVKKQTKIK